MLRRRAGVLLATFAAACSSVNSPTPTGDFTVSAGVAAATTLGTTDTFHVTVQSTNGYAGQVLLTFTGVPTDWVVTLSQNPMTLSANGSAGSTVSLTIPTNGTPAATGDTVVVHATGVGVNHTAPVAVTVANELVVPIVIGADAAKHFGAFTTGTVHLSVGTTVSVLNNDTATHIVHYNGSIGLAHEALTGLGPGLKYSQVVNATGSDILSCHSHVTADSVHLTVP